MNHGRKEDESKIAVEPWHVTLLVTRLIALLRFACRIQPLQITATDRGTEFTACNWKPTLEALRIRNNIKGSYYTLFRMLRIVPTPLLRWLALASCVRSTSLIVIV